MGRLVVELRSFDRVYWADAMEAEAARGALAGHLEWLETLDATCDDV